MVARVEEEGELAGLVGDRAGDRLDGAERVLADVVGQAVEDLGLRLDGEDPAGAAGAGRHEEGIAADIRADVHEGETVGTIRDSRSASSSGSKNCGVKRMRFSQTLLYG